MKQKRNGFTLIELLAVIVVLAIIALIVTPIVLNTINEAREGAAKNSAYGFIEAVENSIATTLLKDTTGTYVMPDLVSTGDVANVQAKGTKPTSVSLVLSKGAVTGGFVEVNGYHIEFGTDGKASTITKVGS